MARLLYDLAGADPERRFSPYCWRIKFALAHKRLAFETQAWRFTEKATLAFSGQDKVPVLVDDGRVVWDSWQIATYLEHTYPDAPSLLGGEDALPLNRFICRWADTVIIPGILRLILADIPEHLHENDQLYFRQSREARFGMTLEQWCADRERHLATLNQALLPLRDILMAQPFIAGDTPNYSDYCVFSAFQWARCVSPRPLLATADPVAAWAERMLGLFDAMAATAPGYAISG